MSEGSSGYEGLTFYLIDRGGQVVASEPIVTVQMLFWPDPPPPPLIDDPAVFLILWKAWGFLTYVKVPVKKVPQLRSELEILEARFEPYMPAAAEDMRRVIALCRTAEARKLRVVIAGP